MIRAEYIQHAGDDLTVVNSARVSFDKESNWDLGYFDTATLGCPKTLSDRDAKLIQYLATHNHFTPFTHATVTLRETCPIFVARQRFKHVVGFTYNEVSRRYVDDEPEFYEPETWRKRSENKKQGSSEDAVTDMVVRCTVSEVEWESPVAEEYRNVLAYAQSVYFSMIDAGVAPEQARMVLPQSMVTSYYVTGSLAAFARFYKQRTDSHAQYETRLLADQVGEIIAPLFPCSWRALTA